MMRLFRHYIPATLLRVLASDLFVIFAAVAVSATTSGWAGRGPVWPKALTVAAIVTFIFHLADLYRVDRRFGAREVVARVLVGLGASAILAAAVGFAFPTLGFGRLSFLELFALLAAVLVTTRVVWNQLRSIDRLRKRVVVLGVSRAAPSIIKLQSTGSQPFTVLGFLDDTPGVHDKLPPGAELLGKSKDLLNIADELQPDLVLVSLPNMRGAFPADDLLQCRLRGIRVEDWPTFYEKQTGKILVTGLRPSWLIFSDGFVKTGLTQTFKRATDIILAAGLLLLSLPMVGLVALVIRATSKGPVLFRQERVGQGGQIFVLYKFRSMFVDAERASGPVWASPDDPRVTPVGRTLRKLRLDEWPQLINVLTGDMSFVGPRPERPEFVRMLQRQIPFYMERLSAKPGITGWAQVRHQYSASVEDAVEKLQYDLYYIKNLSPFLDLLILLSTIQVVLFARGAR